MKQRQSVVRITRSHHAHGVVTTDLVLEEGGWPTEPLAPATIWRDADPPERVLDLHRLISRQATEARFESYAVEVATPHADEPLLFYAWWTTDQLEVARDPKLRWVRRTYDSHDHEHCLLTWEKIRPGDSAYVSEAGWISEHAYRRLVKNDELRLRSTAAR